MIRTKYLEVDYERFGYKEIDELINGFIEDNQQIEIIDIKFQTNLSTAAGDYEDYKYYHTSALIIYKENTK